jgi:hypothetical protein
MKRYVLLFDGDCTACSEVARAVQELSVADLEVMSLRDTRVTAILGQAGLKAPDRPSLLVTDHDDLRVLSGWPMRRRLATVVGWRRSRTIVRLLISECQARLGREVGEPGPTRRRVVGTALGGVVGWAMLSRPATAASADASKAGLVPAAEPDVKRALASEPVGRAARTWGQMKPDVMELRDGPERVLVFSHGQGEDQVFTFVDNSADARRGAPISLSMGNSPSAEQGIRFYTVDGVSLCDVVSGPGSNTTVRPLPQRNRIGEKAAVTPDFNLSCWLLCMQGVRISFGCEATCNSCFDLSGGRLACAHCVFCAGKKAVPCARRCP